VSNAILSATVAAVLAAAMPAAFAQSDMTAPRPATEAARSALPNHVMRGQLRFSDMNGAKVYDAQNNNVGDINNVVLDRDGQVVAVVVKTGAFLGIGGKNVALTMNDLKITTDKDGKPRLSVDMTKDQLKSAQAYDVMPPSSTATGSSTPPESTRK
jgi:methionine-rich copper-binding protein CopC